MILIMQGSTLVPMVVVWLRRRHFSAPVRLLSWYVYLSLLASAAGHLYPAYLPNNYWGIIGFNTAKIALFGALYYSVLKTGPLRRLVRTTTVIALAGCAIACLYDIRLGMTVSRVVQCAVLAAFAVAYLEQTMSRSMGPLCTHDPLWLTSVGQLLYSAGTVTAFSFDILTVGYTNQVVVQYLFIVGAGVLFNAFLTLAFLRARRVAPSGVAPLTQSTNPFAVAPVEYLAR